MTPRPGFIDPRLYQATVLAGLLIYGGLALGFDITASRAALLLGAALATQLACSRLTRLPSTDYRSALISALSLCLLFRTGDPWLAMAAATMAVASKFVVRVNGKHVFNPTNIAVVVLLAVSDRVWVSPGQWGSVGWFAFLMACLGSLVVTRAARADVTIAFLASYAALLIGRAWWLGAALLLFAFFMISDPKSTPDSRRGRVLFAALVAAGGWYVQFRLFHTNGPLWALAACSPLVPVIDYLLPGARYAWPARSHSLLEEQSHAPHIAHDRLHDRPAAAVAR